MTMTFSLLTVFASAFLAATVLPFSSEIVLAAALADESLSRLLLWIAATAGNTLGASINWGLGSLAANLQDRPWFPASQDQMSRAEEWMQRYGQWGLLLAWLPVIGDAIAIVAGTLRVRLGVFVVLVGIGKGIRYAAVIAGADALIF